jgi:predicted nucleotidyltransferase
MEGLAENVELVLDAFLQSAQQVFGPDLLSVVLYGSAAEGRMRAASDVNVMLVLRQFDGAQAAKIRESLNLASAAVRLRAMFLLQEEVAPASEAFAQKFTDVIHRRRILYGPDPFEGLEISRAAKIYRLKQVLLNLTLRLRESYISRGGSEAELEALIAESSGPLRTSAASLLELEGAPSKPPKESFEALLGALDPPLSPNLAATVSESRELRPLKPGTAAASLLELIELASRMRVRAGRLV